MALRELKYNNTIIYVEDEVSDDEMGYALEKNNSKLEDTQEIKPIISEKDLLEDTMSMEPIGDYYE